MIAAGITLRHLHLVWPDLWPMLEPATLLAPEKPDVLGRLLSQHAQLWAIVEDGSPVAAIVTEITLLPEKRCRISSDGHTRMDARPSGGRRAALDGFASSGNSAAKRAALTPQANSRGKGGSHERRSDTSAADPEHVEQQHEQ
jgi:hypothetical protein